MQFPHEVNERKQNVYWYSEIYRAARNEPEVLQAHRSFLLFRDATSGLYLTLLGLYLWMMVGKIIPVQYVSIWSVAILVVMVVSVSWAVRQSGDRMVANVVEVALGTDVEPENC